MPELDSMNEMSQQHTNQNNLPTVELEISIEEEIDDESYNRKDTFNALEEEKEFKIQAQEKEDFRAKAEFLTQSIFEHFLKTESA